jgi:hypothetical protein
MPQTVRIPRRADRIPGRPATHACEPRLGQSAYEEFKRRVQALASKHLTPTPTPTLTPTATLTLSAGPRQRASGLCPHAVPLRRPLPLRRTQPGRGGRTGARLRVRLRGRLRGRLTVRHNLDAADAPVCMGPTHSPWLTLTLPLTPTLTPTLTTTHTRYTHAAWHSPPVPCVCCECAVSVL